MTETLTYSPVQLSEGNNLAVYVRQYDPTRTTTLRNAFAQDMRRRFNWLIRLVNEAIIDKDVLGIGETQGATLLSLSGVLPTGSVPGRQAFAFATTAEKNRAFMTWFRQQVNLGVLETTNISQLGRPIFSNWTDTYITDSYKRGVQRARYEMSSAGMKVPTMAQTGGIGFSMGMPMHIDRAGILYSRTFEGLKGITQAMDTQISQVLSQGMIDGDGPRLLARKLAKTITGPVGNLGMTDTLGRFIPARRRAEMLARTEIIRAHHQATIQEYQNYGVAGVKVKAEFTTAGDDRVCPECLSYEAQVFTLEKIRGLIPIHPSCRCMALPVEVREPIKTTSPTRDSVERGIKKAYRPQYNKYKKEYDSYFKQWGKGDMKEYVRYSKVGRGGEGMSDAAVSRGYRMKQVLRAKVKADFPEVMQSGMEWMESTMTTNPMRLKRTTQFFETRVKNAKMHYPSHMSAGDIAKLEAMPLYSAEEYLRMRAFNQAFMEAAGVNKVQLYRGVGGRTGQSLRILLEGAERSPGVTHMEVSEVPLTGFTRDIKVAHVFGPDDSGIMYKYIARRDQIVWYDALFGRLQGSFAEELESILIGATRNYNLNNLTTWLF